MRLFNILKKSLGCKFTFYLTYNHRFKSWNLEINPIEIGYPDKEGRFMGEKLEDVLSKGIKFVNTWYKKNYPQF